MKVGHQTYSWEMLGSEWRGSADDILDAVAAAGYQGVEFSNLMIGGYVERPDELKAALAKRGLTLAAFAYGGSGFTDPASRDMDLAGAWKALKIAARFSVVLGLAGPSSTSRDDAEAKLARACRFYDEVAREGSLFRWLHQSGYDGWLISEEESEIVWKDLPGAIARNRAYFRSLGL
jgi:sugar phosphate isomerase/epimerase